MADLEPESPPSNPVENTSASLSPEPETTRPWGLLRRGDCLVLLVLCAGCLALSITHWIRLTRGGIPPADLYRPASNSSYRVEINSATWVELMQLDGLGESTARQVVANREANGPFRDVDDLLRIKGVGAATLEKLRPQVVCRANSDNATPPNPLPRTSKKRATKGSTR